MKIFNIRQANIFIQNQCKVISCGLGDRYKAYIEFEEDQIFKAMLKRWHNKEF